MSASISMKRKSVGMEFLRKAASHITGATGDYISEVMPVTTSTLSEAKSTMSSVSTVFANTSQSILPKVRQLKTQMGFKAISNWFMEREEDFSNFGAMDASLSFDIDTDPADIAESQITEIGKSANQVSQAVVESSHKLVESQISATANLISAANQQTAAITSGFDRTNATLNSILEVLTKNTATLIETMAVSQTPADVNDKMAGSGRFSLSEYKKMVTGNAKNSEIGMFASMIPSLINSGTLKQFLTPQSVIQTLIGFAVDKKAPNFKKNAAALDNAINDTIMTSLIRLGENNDYGWKGQLAKIFGIDSSRKDVNTSRSSLELKTVPFDSIAHESITNTIPGYLRKILVAVGGEDVVYDYRSRRFRTQRSINKEFKNVAANTGMIYGASRKVKESIGYDDFSSMIYDLMMTELGSRTSNGSARSTVSKFANTEETQKYLLNTVLAGMDLSPQEVEAVKIVASNLGKASSGTGVIDIMNQVSRGNVDRSNRTNRFVDTANKHNMDLSSIVDSIENDRKVIAARYGKEIKDESSTASIAGGRSKNLSGVNYTNMALYEIFRKLNDGINVFQVGHKNLRHTPFKVRGNDYLPEPESYKPKKKGEGLRGSPEASQASISGMPSNSEESNLLQNQQLDDGSTETLTHGERFLRWGKKRGGNLARSMFSGSPEDVKDAFSVIIRDISQVASSGIKSIFMGNGDQEKNPDTGKPKLGGVLGKVNDAFGDVAGFVRFKFMGGKWTDEHGQQQQGEGYLGKMTKSISEFFKGDKNGRTKAPSLLGLFRGETSSDPREDQKRKKIAGAATGALVAQLGFLGGPIGMIVGGLAGSAISVSGIGEKISKMILGEVGQDGKKTGGIINKAGKFFGKMMGYTDDMSEADKKNRKRTQLLGGIGGLFTGAGLGLIGGPIGMLACSLGGAAVSTSGLGTKITDMVLGKRGTSGRRYGGLVSAINKAGDFILTPFKWLGKGISSTFKAGKKFMLDPILNIGKGFTYFLFGNKEKKTPGLVQEVFNNTIGVVFNEGKTLIKNTLSTVSHKIVDPITDILFTMRKRITYGISDFFIGKKDKDGKRSGGIFSGFANYMSEAGKNFKEGLGSALKTIFSSPFALLRILNPFKKNDKGESESIWTKEGRGNIAGKFTGVGEAFRSGGIASGLKSISTGISSVGRNDNIKSGNLGADFIAGSDDRLIHDLEQRRLSREDRRREGAPGSIIESFGDLVKINEEEVERNKQAHEEQMQVQQDIAAHQNELYLLHKPAFDKMVTPGSIYTHDIHIEERFDKLLDVVSSKDGTSSISETVSNPIIGSNLSGIAKRERAERKAETERFGNTLLGAAVSVADEGGIDKDDASGLEKIAMGSQNGESKNSIFSKFKDLVKRNIDKSKDRHDVEEEKEESFLSKMFGGLGKVLLDNWPLVLGGIALLSDKFRDFLGKTLETVGSWLIENVPKMIAGAWDLAKGVNREIENAATGSDTVIDPVTGELKSVTSAEQHAAHISEGTLSSAVDITSNPLRLAKDFGIISAERAGIRLGAAGVQGASKLVGGTAGLINGGAKLATGAKYFGKEAAFAFKESMTAGNGVLKSVGTGIKQGRLFGSLATQYSGGSVAAQKVAGGAAKTAAEASGVKTMMSKTFSVKTLLKPTAIANITGGIAADFSAGVGWESMEIQKHGNYVGNYGLGNAGGFARTNTTVKTVTTTTIGLGGGIAIGAAVGAAQATIAGTIASAAGLTAAFAAPNGWNPVGWCALIIAGVLLLAAGIAALVNWLTGLITNGANKDYAIRSNSSKLNAVISDRVKYEDGKVNPMYVYCARESDRVLGLNEGVNIKDPEYVFGKYLKQIADGLASSPGTEVLLYDFINNMAVQGVPFACLMAGDSDECKLAGEQANTSSVGLGETTRTGPLGGQYTQVKKSTVQKNKSKVFADIGANISRQDPEVVWTEENLKLVYDAGKRVADALTSKGIIKGDGKVDTGKFKGTPGAKNSGGWKALDELARQNGSYFLTQCLVYINSKIQATKDEKQWLEDRKDDVLKLMEGLKDYFVKEAEATVAEMKASGMSDKEIEQALAASADPKGNKATESGGLAVAESSISNVANSKIKQSDKADVDKELKYLAASWAYSHPTVLQEWVNKHQKESSISPDNIRRVSTWKSEYKNDKRQQQILRGEMANAALRFGEANGDIFNLVPKFDWSEGGKLYTGKPKSPANKHGSGFVIRGEEKGPNSGILDQLWDSGQVGQEKTPEDIHDQLFGSKEHGKGAETSGTTDKWWVWTSGVLGRIADKISQFGSKEGEELSKGPSSDKWKNVLTNLPASNPPNVGVGGSDDEVPNSLASSVVNGAINTATTAMNSITSSLSKEEGGNPLNQPFTVSSSFGWRDLNNDGNIDDYHKGIDIYPSNGQPGVVGSRYNGTVRSVRNNVPDSTTGLGAKPAEGNMVSIDTDNGFRITNMHLKAGSIPDNIKPGAKVSVGDMVGVMGSTGNSSGPHLHYQIENPAGTPVDPLPNISGGSQISSFVDNSTGIKTSYSEGVPDVGDDTSSSVTDTGEAKSGLGLLVDLISKAGYEFLNYVTGGLLSIGDKKSDKGNTNDTSAISFDDRGMSVGTSGSLGFIDGPVEYLPTKEVAAIQTKREKKEVIDLTTGKSFFVSWAASPTYHSDWTPMTPEDVKIIWSFLHPDGGGNINNPDHWSWNARPGVLKLNGRMIACGFHLRPHAAIMGGNPGAPFSNKSNTPFAYSKTQKWPLGGHMCMYYGDSPGGTPKCNDAAREAYKLGNAMFSAQAASIATSKASIVNGSQNGVLGTGDTVTVPSDKGTFVTFEKEILDGKYDSPTHGWAKSSAQGVMRKDAIAKGRLKAANIYGLQNVATIDGRALIATPYPSIGNQLPVTVGDHLDVQFDDGSVWNTMVGDFKDPKDPGSTIWGHGNGKNTVELIYWDYKQNPKNVNKKVKSITKTGKTYNNSIGTQDQINGALSSHGAVKTVAETVVNSSITGNTKTGGGVGGTTGVPSKIGSPSYSLSSSSIMSKIASIGKNNISTFDTRNPGDVSIPVTSAQNETFNSGRSIDTVSNDIKSDGVIKRIEMLLYQVVQELAAINSNTGTSSDLLGSLNEKDFVDKGLRDSLAAASKSNKKSYAARHVQTNPNNVRTISAMARP